MADNPSANNNDPSKPFSRPAGAPPPPPPPPPGGGSSSKPKSPDRPKTPPFDKAPFDPAQGKESKKGKTLDRAPYQPSVPPPTPSTTPDMFRGPTKPTAKPSFEPPQGKPIDPPRGKPVDRTPSDKAQGKPIDRTQDKPAPPVSAPPPVKATPPPPKPMAQKKPAQALPPAATAPTPPKDQIVIRTMQEDLKGIKTGKPVAPQPVTGLSPAPGKLPLPPGNGKPVPGKNKSGLAPKTVAPPTGKRRGKLVPILVILLLVVLIGAGGTFAWTRLTGNSHIPGSTPSTVGQGIESLIPADTALIVQYKLISATDRTATLSAWQNSEPPSVTNLLQGDPRLLINESAVEEFYYVLLPDESRPYLLVPATDTTTQLLSNEADVSTTVRSDWIIAHPLDTSAYENELAVSTLDSIGGEPVLQATSPETPMRLVLGPGTLIGLREDIAGSAFANGDIQAASIASRFVSGKSALTISGAAATLSTLGEGVGTVDHKVLSFMPATTTVAALGTHFGTDISTLAATSGELDTAMLQQPAVAALLEQLDTPYGMFIDSSTPSPSYGLIVRLPAAINSTLPLGDTNLEAALRALVPLLTGRKSVAPLAFNNGVYRDIPLRFVNISGSNEAIDYAKSDSYLLAATSKETMFGLLDAASGQTVPLNASPEWFELFSLWGALPQAERMAVATTDDPTLLQFVPGTPASMQFGITLDALPEDTTDSRLMGVVQLFP